MADPQLLSLIQGRHRRRLGRHQHRAALAGLEAKDLAVQPVINTCEPVAQPKGPVQWHRIDSQNFFNLAQQSHRIATVAIHFVDKCQDGNTADCADLEQFARLLLNALGGVYHHHRAVGRSKSAIGILAEVAVARRVQQVDDQAAVAKAQDRGGDGDAALPFHLHPVRGGGAFGLAATHSPGDRQLA